MPRKRPAPAKAEETFEDVKELTTGSVDTSAEPEVFSRSAPGRGQRSKRARLRVVGNPFRPQARGDDVREDPGSCKDRWDWAIALVCISVGIIGFRTVNDSLLWGQLMDTGSGRQVIGTLVKKKGGVRFRSGDSQLWHDVYAGSEPVSAGDTVFTSEDGTAELKLEDGSVAEIEPNSLIVVQRSADVLPEEKSWEGALGSFFATKKQESLLKIERGGAKLALKADASPLKLQVKGKVYNLSSKASDGSAKVSVDGHSAKGAKFASMSASGVELSEAGAGAEKIQVGLGQEAVLQGGQGLKVQAVRISPVSPAPGEQLLLEPGVPAVFSWKAIGAGARAGGALLQLEIEGANAPAGSRATALAPAESSARVALPEGAYRWRVVGAPKPQNALPGAGAAEPGIETPWQGFSVVTLAPPKPIGPLQGAWITLPRGESLASVLFSWQAPPPGLLPEIEWTRLPDEGAPANAAAPSPKLHLADESVSGWQTLIAAGTYEWRARTRSSDEEERVSAWSRSQRFTVRIENPLPQSGDDPASMPPPSVILAEGAPAAPVPSAPVAPPPPNPAQVAKAQAVAKAKAKAAAIAIKSRMLTVVKTTTSSTQLAASGTEKLDEITVPIRWGKLPDAKFYELLVTEALSGKKILRERTQKPEFDWRLDSLEETRFNYKVTAVTTAGERISTPPVPMEIQVSAPVLKRPGPDAKVTPTRSGAILMTWQSTVLTDHYVLQVSSDPSFRGLEVDERVASNLYIAKGLKPGTRYYWRVRSSAHGRDSAWSAAGSFSVVGSSP
jgi:hypothetical protein